MKIVIFSDYSLVIEWWVAHNLSIIVYWNITIRVVHITCFGIFTRVIKGLSDFSLLLNFWLFYLTYTLFIYTL